ncbi:MAG: TolC family protein [Desulfatitalea sp.]|nr:TolC family protein [Desulfatitalea sp.]NNK00699.1 TolC family protein [Desulfatitalea sp.]
MISVKAASILLALMFATTGTLSAQGPTALTIEACIKIALEKNQQRRISRLDVETAEAQLKQALSSYWPQLSFESALTHLDEDINFIFPTETSLYTIRGLGPVAIPAQVEVPAKTIKVLDQNNLMSRIKFTYPIFTGGLRGALVRQGQAGVAAAQQAHRRSEVQLVYDVQRFYYGAILAQHLSRVGQRTLAQLETTMELTEMLYQAGSASVNKRDYLRSKVFLESVRSIVTLMASNVELAHTALANTMGYAWDQPIRLAQDHIPYEPVGADLTQMISDAYRFNPDWKQLEAAIDAFEARVDEARADHFPKIGLNGTLWRWDNSMNNSGLSTDQNMQGWTVGVGVKFPLFSGFLTTQKVKAARTALEAMKARQILFKGGLAVQIKQAFLELTHAQKIHDATLAASQMASEYRDLTERAYRQEMIDADAVIESQIMEALTTARAEQALYGHAEAQLKLSYLVGCELEQQFQSTDSPK